MDVGKKSILEKYYLFYLSESPVTFLKQLIKQSFYKPEDSSGLDRCYFWEKYLMEMLHINLRTQFVFTDFAFVIPMWKEILLISLPFSLGFYIRKRLGRKKWCSEKGI